MYTQNEIMEFIKEEDVKFIKLAFCDIFGRQKNISITNNELQHVLENGIAIDASSIKCFSDTAKSDLILHPDISTLTILPWRPEHGKVVRMFCDIKHPDGTPFECDSRLILKNAVKSAEEKGLSFVFGSKIDFYLLKLDEKGNRTSETYDNATYMDVAPYDKGENIRREICLTLDQMGIYPKSSHHEEGAGQNEINFRYADPVTAANDVITFRQVVSIVANRNGLYADFSPKPIKNAPGNGFYVSFSIKSKDGKDNLMHSISGILDKINDCTIFFNNSENSYDRLNDNFELFRLPVSKDELKFAELRSPDSLANPYITFALIIYSALLGIESNKEPVNTQSKLPSTIKEAKNIALQSEFIKTHLPKKILSSYCESK